MRQREYMRRLYARFGDEPDILIRRYADAERKGIVCRAKNTFDLTAEQYAAALYRDGKRKGWITQS